MVHAGGVARSPRAAPRGGFTLIELVMALGIYAVILATMALAIQLIARAHPHARGDRPALMAAATALKMADDLRFAISFSETSVDAVEFSVTDRNGDGIDEKISYAWSAIQGDPLLRTENSGAPETVMEDAHAFALTYELSSLAASPLGEELAILKYHDDAPGGHFHDHKLESAKWCGQYFEPDLPAGVTEWKIKRIRIMAKREGDDHTGVFEVWVTGADNTFKPTNEILDYAIVYESDLDDAYTWVDLEFTALNSLDPNDGLCIVLAQVLPTGSAAKIPYNHGGDVMTSGTHWIKSGDAGASWSGPVSDKDLRFFVFGTYDNYEPTEQKYVTGVRLHLQSSLEPDESVSTTVRILNAPGIQP